jgi:hypothetical protein
MIKIKNSKQIECQRDIQQVTEMFGSLEFVILELFVI